MFYKYQDTRRFVSITVSLCIIGLLLTAVIISENSCSPHQNTFVFLQSKETEEITTTPIECIGDTLTLWEYENDRIYRNQTEQIIDKAAITHLVYKPQTDTDYSSAQPKILAENDCGTWYVKITIPDERSNIS